MKLLVDIALTVSVILRVIPNSWADPKFTWRARLGARWGPYHLFCTQVEFEKKLWTAALTCFNFPTCRWRWTGTWWFVENGWDDGNILPFKEHDCVRTCHQSTWACARQDSNYSGMWMDVGHSDQHTTPWLDLHKQKLLPGLRHPRTQSEAPPLSSPTPRWTVETTNSA